jgi:S-formylglutathione hydrolase
MYDYVTRELPALIESSFPVTKHRSISGHSMGGHGALTIALRETGNYRSVSAFSPIANPVQCPWGQKAFSAYLGADVSVWKEHDASILLAKHKGEVDLPILVDQGDADGFMQEQLKPDTLLAAATHAEIPINLRMQPGYDHSYFFISTFIDDHIAFHAKALCD